MTIHVHTHYIRLEHYYEEAYKSYLANKNYYNDDDQQQQEPGGGDNENSMDRQYQEMMALTQLSSKSITFVALYTISLAVALSLYGSTAIVGFTSLQGVYIGPCFSSALPPKLKVGIFGGSIIFFANLLLVCAVIFGEV
jgi:hypothetical protein